MSADNAMSNRKSSRIILNPPTFSPPADMRKGYLERRKAELDTLLANAKDGEWKPVENAANHVRGTGAMYGFEAIGGAAETLVRAIQNNDANCAGLLEKYVATVNES